MGAPLGLLRRDDTRTAQPGDLRGVALMLALLQHALGRDHGVVIHDGVPGVEQRAFAVPAGAEQKTRACSLTLPARL